MKNVPSVAERVKRAGDAVLAAYRDDARTVINALIEFGEHLSYCRTKDPLSLLNAQCDCGRDQAATDARNFMELGRSSQKEKV